MKKLEVLVTLWPEMTHYERFAADARLGGIRLNTAMADPKTFPGLLLQAQRMSETPLYVDVKGRQLRVTEVIPSDDHLECRLNHPVSVKTPTTVLFKAGADAGLLSHVEEDGYKLVFEGGPAYNVIKGESLHIRSPDLIVGGELFTADQREYLAAARALGVDRYMLSYVGSKKEIEEMRTLVGDALIIAKIEDRKGLEYVQREYARAPNAGLLTARGDLFVEVKRPHEIIEATRRIVRKEPDAILGSRILLSVTNEAVPSCADLSELAWLIEQGYHRFMFCDGLCLKPEPLERAINVLRAVYRSYEERQPPEGNPLRFFSMKRYAERAGLWP